LEKSRSDTGIGYRYVTALLDRDRGCVDITVRGPDGDPPADVAGVHELGDRFWPLAVTRELDDLILDLRTNELELGTWLLRSQGDPGRVLAHDAVLLDWGDDELGA